MRKKPQTTREPQTFADVLALLSEIFIRSGAALMQMALEAPPVPLSKERKAKNGRQRKKGRKRAR